MPKFKVVGILEVADKRQGEVVELDPEKVNIPALIEAGHVEPVNEKPPTKEASK